MTTIITKNDLAGLPGVTGTDTELEYAARRAGVAVESAWATPVDPVPQWVKDLATDVAVRYLNNPRGVTSVTRSVDDASRTERYGERGAPLGGGFTLTDDELARLSAIVRRRVGSTRLAVPGYQP